MASNAPTLAVGAPKGDASQQRTPPSGDSHAPLAGEPDEMGKNAAVLQASNGTTLDKQGGAKRAVSPAAVPGGDGDDKRRKVVEQVGGGGGGSVGGAAPGQTASAGPVAGDSAGEPAAAGAATAEAAGAAAEGAALTALWTRPPLTAPGAPVAAVVPVAVNATLLGRTPHRHQSSLCLSLTDSIETAAKIKREG